MKSALATVMLAMSLSTTVFTTGSASAQGMTEAQCRLMIDTMLERMKTTPMPNERDRQGAQAVIDRVDRLVRDNRARRVAECETWAAFSKILFVG